MATAEGNTSFNITLPNEIIETMMDLLPSKAWGTNRAEIARQLIIDMVKRLDAEGTVRLRGLPPRQL
jgi:hypothetical protein